MIGGYGFEQNNVINNYSSYKTVSQVALEQNTNSAIANFTQWRHRSQREAVTCLDVKSRSGFLKVSISSYRMPLSSSIMVLKAVAIYFRDIVASITIHLQSKFQ